MSNNGRLDFPIRNHLKNVYSCTAAASFSAAIGCVAYTNDIFDGGWWCVGASIIFLALVGLTERELDGSNDAQRITYLNIFAFCMGNQAGPGIKAAWDLDPVIIVSALIITSVIFVCFSLAAIISPEKQYLWLGAPLLSIFGTLLVAQILNYFIQSQRLRLIHLIVSPIIGSMFILYDTQRIMEKFRQNDRDYVLHALFLFVDVLALFKDIVQLLLSRESSRRSGSGSND